MKHFSTIRPEAPNSAEVMPDGMHRRGYLLLNVGGWVLFGAAMMVGWLDVHSWHVVLATTPVYILIGFFMSLLLGLVYERLGLGPGSFARALAICVAGSSVGGVLWNVANY